MVLVKQMGTIEERRRIDFAYFWVILLSIVGLSKEGQPVTEKPKETKDGSKFLNFMIVCLVLILFQKLWLSNM